MILTIFHGKKTLPPEEDEPQTDEDIENLSLSADKMQPSILPKTRCDGSKWEKTPLHAVFYKKIWW